MYHFTQLVHIILVLLTETPQFNGHTLLRQGHENNKRHAFPEWQICIRSPSLDFGLLPGGRFGTFGQVPCYGRKKEVDVRFLNFCLCGLHEQKVNVDLVCK